MRGTIERVLSSVKTAAAPRQSGKTDARLKELRHRQGEFPRIL